MADRGGGGSFGDAQEGAAPKFPTRVAADWLLLENIMWSLIAARLTTKGLAVLWVVVVVGIILGGGFRVGAEEGLQPGGETAIARSTVLQRILLVGTLDGSLFAFDRHTGVLLWENGELGGPVVTRSATDGDSTGPAYVVEPLNQGSIYACVPDAGVKVSISKDGLSLMLR